MINCASNISENEERKVHKPIKQSELQKEDNRVHETTNTHKTGQDREENGPLDTDVRDLPQEEGETHDSRPQQSSLGRHNCQILKV